MLQAIIKENKIYCPVCETSNFSSSNVDLYTYKNEKIFGFSRRCYDCNNEIMYFKSDIGVNDGGTFVKIEDETLLNKIK